MRVYADPFEVTQKEDRTPVTEADLASERAIVAILGAAVPDIPIVSEETVPAPGFRRRLRGSGASIRSTGPGSSSPATTSSR